MGSASGATRPNGGRNELAGGKAIYGIGANTNTVDSVDGGSPLV
jgi:hypothetical protein